MQAGLNSRLIEVDAIEVAGWLKAGEAMLIDVREADEHAEERIPGAALVPWSSFDPYSVPVAPGKKLVIHCLGGHRSEKAGRCLIEAGFGQAIHIRDGLFGWKIAGLPTEGADTL
ncbi:MAG: rhodanese-like domain-containing protein [Alphaproteobacteria bacterium]|nr:rhodanese-like domain-containing protein [Alphaproteobacteria bacterium]